MGEIDTKPIESVQAALFLFGEKNSHRRYRPAGHEGKLELEEKELDLILKDLSSYKVQLEVKESACQQALLKLQLYQKTVLGLSMELRNCVADRDKHIEECRAAKIHVDELQSKIMTMTDQLSEMEKAQEKLFQAVNELNSAQEDLLKARAELASAEESKLAAMEQVELLETASAIECEKTKELLKNMSELNEAIILSKLAAIEAQKEKTAIMLVKETDLQMATVTAVQAKEELEDKKKQMDMMPVLENQLAEKSLLINSLQMQLKEANELYASSEKADSDAINSINLLKSELEQMKRTNSDLAKYAQSMETELKQLQSELNNAREEVCHSNNEVEVLSRGIQKAQGQIDKLRNTEGKAQVDIAMLKSELHRVRSKIAAAEAGEARAQSMKSGLYLAVKQLAIEAQVAKFEAGRSYNLVNPKLANSTRTRDLFQDEPKSEMGKRTGEADSQISISVEEYNYLTRKVEEIDQVSASVPKNVPSNIASEKWSELGALTEELEAARVEIIKLKSVADKAVSRAELAEKDKAVVEDQLRKWREQKQRRRAALATLREESAPKARYPPSSDMLTRSYQPLGKVLNIEF